VDRFGSANAANADGKPKRRQYLQFGNASRADDWRLALPYTRIARRCRGLTPLDAVKMFMMGDNRALMLIRMPMPEWPQMPNYAARGGPADSNKCYYLL